MSWRRYRIGPCADPCAESGAFSAPPEGFLAPSLESAFAMARARWPAFKTWSCLGSKPS